jgi:hypothetical protein
MLGSDDLVNIMAGLVGVPLASRLGGYPIYG